MDGPLVFAKQFEINALSAHRLFLVGLKLQLLATAYLW